MYHAHWGLERSPFVGADASDFYEGESQTEALARLRYVAEQRRHALLTGPRGVGKSLLLQQYARNRRQEGLETAMLSLAGLAQREFYWRIAAELALAPRPTEDAAGLFRQLTDHGAAVAWSYGPPVALLLDDVDQAGADVRIQLLRLLRVAGEPRPWLTLALAAPPAGARRLGDELLDAIDLQIELEPWSEAETVGYVQHALVTAGADRPVFDDEALAVLYALTDGVPRKVNRLADHALLGAAAVGLETVDAATIESARDALAWATPTA